ncbi:MAG: DegV family protein [Anaerolineaceae bacterium]|jgi:DegV family protein with EDD domain|nr:DegV family protein [Anaerolineaceae bacterium]
MQIVTDHAVDVAPEQVEGLDLYYVPLNIILEGKTYHGGADLPAKKFYEMLAETESLPSTSQPSPAEFAEVYRKLAKKEPDILSIHISSALSGTYNSAKLAAEMVPEANITLVDSKTVSCPLSWQVLAAARAVKAGWPLELVLSLVNTVSQNSDAMFTLGRLKYLVHGGRVGHMKGLLAALLNIKPILGVDRVTGMLDERGKQQTVKRAIRTIVDKIAQVHPEGSALRVQIMHGDVPDSVALLQDLMNIRFDCHWEPVVQIAPVLGAHTGPTIVGISYGLLTAYKDIP